MVNVMPSDLIVLVMGMTGVGKSSFISSLVGEDVGIGHGVDSCTAGLTLHCMEAENRKVYLVDTPGFNDTWRSDDAILKEIAYFLAQTYRTGLRVGGIVYLHSIAENRVTGSAAKNFAMLERLCGPDAARQLILATTKWDLVGDEADQREAELISTKKFWGTMFENGSRVQRWDGHRPSALAIVQSLTVRADTFDLVPLRIQLELVDQSLALEDTLAGQEILQVCTQSWQNIRAELDDIRTELGQGNRDFAHASDTQTRRTRLRKDRAANDALLQQALASEDAALHHELTQQHQKLQAGVDTRLAASCTQIVKEKKRSVVRRNVIPLLACLAGVSTIAAGAATALIPIVAVGIAVTGTAATKLDFHRARTRRKEEEPWEIAEYDD